jgi:hypothetical protein
MKQAPSIRRVRALVPACAVFSLATLFTGVAHAQWQVIDNTVNQTLQDNIGDNSNGSLNSMTYKLLSQINNTGSDLGFSASNLLLPSKTPIQLQKITDASPYISQACSGQSSGANQSVSSIAVPPGGASSSASQQVCQQIVQLRVQLINETVDMANRFQAYQTQLAQIDQNRTQLSTQGQLWANTNESTRTIGKLQAEMAFWRTRVVAYDSTIKLLESQQNALTQAAIQGNTSSISAGSLIQTGTLAAALAIN